MGGGAVAPKEKKKGETKTTFITCSLVECKTLPFGGWIGLTSIGINFCCRPEGTGRRRQQIFGNRRYLSTRLHGLKS